MLTPTPTWRVLLACLALAAFGSAGCSRSSLGCSRGTDGAGGVAGSGGSSGAAGKGGTDGAGEAGKGGTGDISGVSGVGGAGDAGAVGEARNPDDAAPLVLNEGQQILFIGGFLSELYEELSLNLEDEINDALQSSARSLNVHIDLPFDQSIDIPIGDAIANALPRIDLPIQSGGFITFYTQMRDFDAQGIDYKNLSAASRTFDTSESVGHNAAAVLRFLRRTNKQIIIVSHSKGGLDTLEALIGAPELWGDTVIGWVALQAPFHGSPVADQTFVAANDFLLEALGGNGQSAGDLKTDAREPYMSKNEARIAKLTASIPVISAYSTYEASGTVTDFARTFASGIFNSGMVSEISQIVVRNYRDTPRDVGRVISASTSAAIRVVRERAVSALGNAMATIGLVDLTNVYMHGVLEMPNDGLVPSESTRLPGAIHRELETGDHASPVMDVGPYKNFWPVQKRNAVTVDLIREVQKLAEAAPSSGSRRRK